MRSATIMTLLAGGLISSVAAANPFDDLIKGGNDVCFRRVYDAAHLKKHPGQQTTSMTVWITGDVGARSGNIGLSVTRRGDPEPLFLSGDCSWDNFAGPPHWMPSFTKKTGAGCLTSAVPDVFPESSSAEEGGAIILDPAADGKTMIVHLDDSPSLVKRAARWKVIPIKLGRDDRVFLLRRTALKDCEFVKEAVTTMEPPDPEGRRR